MKVRSKYVWSHRYGKNPREGLHKFLEGKFLNYKRNTLDSLINEFLDSIGETSHMKFGSKKKVIYTQRNFGKFVEFINLKRNG